MNLKTMALNTASAILICAVQGLGLYALMAPQPVSAGDQQFVATSRNSTTYIAFTRERKNCPADQMRVYVAVDSRQPHAFCWRGRGELVDLFDGSTLITSLPVHSFDVETRRNQ